MFASVQPLFGVSVISEKSVDKLKKKTNTPVCTLVCGTSTSKRHVRNLKRNWSPNWTIVEENIIAFKAIFPACVTCTPFEQNTGPAKFVFTHLRNKIKEYMT